MDTVIALFSREEGVDAALAELDEHGISREAVGVLASRDHYDHYYDERSGRFGDEVISRDDTKRADVAEGVDSDVVEEAVKGAAGGAAGGAVSGGTAGLLAGAGVLAIPGVGPFLAGGALGAALIGAGSGATVGGAAGGILGSIFGAAEDEDDGDGRTPYQRGLEEGALVVAVETTDAQSEAIAQRLRQVGADDVEVRSS